MSLNEQRYLSKIQKVKHILIW